MIEFTVAYLQLTFNTFERLFLLRTLSFKIRDKSKRVYIGRWVFLCSRH